MVHVEVLRLEARDPQRGKQTRRSDLLLRTAGVAPLRRFRVSKPSARSPANLRNRKAGVSSSSSKRTSARASANQAPGPRHRDADALIVTSLTILATLTSLYDLLLILALSAR